MIKKKVVFADHDAMYLSNLSNYLMENAPQIELITFTKTEKLEKFLAEGNQVEIAVVDEAFASAQLADRLKDATKIVLSSTMRPIDGFESIKKYQKTEALLSEILLKHSEHTGTIEAICGKSNTKIVAFYSPAGGVGKTVLSLALAASGASMGLKVLYLNLEEVDSMTDVLGKTPGTLSDLFLSLKTKGSNAGIKLTASVGRASDGGFFYISGTESISEHGEIDGSDLAKLMTAIRDLSDYDLTVIDLSSGFNEKTKKVLENSDIIFAPVRPEEGSVTKMKRLLRESDIHEMYDKIIAKMNLIVNRAGFSGPGPEIQSSGLADRLPVTAVIAESPAFANIKGMLKQSGALGQVVSPLIQTIQAL